MSKFNCLEIGIIQGQNLYKRQYDSVASHLFDSQIQRFFFENPGLLPSDFDRQMALKKYYSL
jgi:hypothetical protein